MVLSLLEEQEYKRYIEAFDFSKYMKDKTFLITGSNGMTGQAMVKWILYLNSRYQMNAKYLHPPVIQNTFRITWMALKM